MKQYYVLSRDQRGELTRWILPADNIDGLINKFKNSDYRAGQEIMNFAVRVPGMPEPDWFKVQESNQQLSLFKDVVNL